MAGREVTLRGYIESLIKAHQREHEAHEQGHLREHSNARQAIDVAVESMDKRLDGVSELRAALRDAQVLETAAMSARLDKLEDADIARTTREQEREATTLRREKERDEGIRRTMAFFALLASIGGFMLALIVQLFRT